MKKDLEVGGDYEVLHLPRQVDIGEKPAICPCSALSLRQQAGHGLSSALEYYKNGGSMQARRMVGN